MQSNTQPNKTRYTPHSPKYPTAQDTKNLLLHEIELKYEIEIIAVFSRIEDARKSYHTGVEIAEDIPYPVLLFIQSKVYQVEPS